MPKETARLATADAMMLTGSHVTLLAAYDYLIASNVSQMIATSSYYGSGATVLRHGHVRPCTLAWVGVP